MKKETLIKQTFDYKETRGIIIADNQKAVSAAQLAMQEHRKRLEKYILQNPIFLSCKYLHGLLPSVCLPMKQPAIPLL